MEVLLYLFVKKAFSCILVLFLLLLEVSYIERHIFYIKEWQDESIST